MRRKLSKLTQAGVVFAAIATGAIIVSVASAQSAPANKKTQNATTGAKTVSGKSGKSAGKKSRRSKRVKGQAAPTADRITEIQEVLAKKGGFDGMPTGKWDNSTVDAMKKFQAANHLNPTGKLDAPTLQKLGLGSETAGVAAPIPPPNSSANRLLSRSAQRDPEPADNN